MIAMKTPVGVLMMAMIRIRNDDDDSNDDQDVDRGGHDHVDAPDTGMIVINDVDASSLLL